MLWGVHQVRHVTHTTPDTSASAYVVDSYLIILKSLIPSVIASLYHDLTSPDTNPPEWALNGRMWILLLMVVLGPLSFLRRLDSLRHTSYVALFSCGEYLLAHIITRRAESLYSLACSIPRLDSDCMPLPSVERDDTTWRNTSHQDHTQLCFNVPHPSFRLHLCPERNVLPRSPCSDYKD